MLRRHATVIGVGARAALFARGCGAGTAQAAASSTRTAAAAATAATVAAATAAAGSASPDAAAAPAARTNRPPARVLVTGFCDWKDLGMPPNLWRCRDNPSCRLLVGKTAQTPPPIRAGELATMLRAAAPEVEWCFETLTTTWMTAAGLDLQAFDAVHSPPVPSHVHSSLTMVTPMTVTTMACNPWAVVAHQCVLPAPPDVAFV